MLDICLQNILTMGLMALLWLPSTRRLLCLRSPPRQLKKIKTTPQTNENPNQKPHMLKYKLKAVLNPCGNTERDNYTRKGWAHKKPENHMYLKKKLLSYFLHLLNGRRLFETECRFFFLPCHSFAMGSQISYVKKTKKILQPSQSYSFLSNTWALRTQLDKKKKKKSHISV